MEAVIIDPQPLGPLSEEKLREFELSHDFELPRDYRDFLLTYNGGKPSPEFFWITKPTDGTSVEHFYGLHDGPQWYSISGYDSDEVMGIPESLLPIADDGVGNIICLGVTDPIYGQVFFLDHEEHLFQDPGAMDGVSKLADSFEEFLALLEPIPEGE